MAPKDKQRRPQRSPQRPTPPSPAAAVTRTNEQLAAELEQLAPQHAVAEGAEAMLEAAARLRGAPGTVEYEPALMLDGIAHVMRGKTLHVVHGGVLVTSTDLTADEIDELTAQRIIRFATQDELAALLEPGETDAPDPASDASDASDVSADVPAGGLAAVPE